MTESEIVRSIKTAKNMNKQISITAQLAGMTTTQVREICRRNGVVLPERAKRKPPMFKIIDEEFDKIERQRVTLPQKIAQLQHELDTLDARKQALIDAKRALGCAFNIDLED